MGDRALDKKHSWFTGEGERRKRRLQWAEVDRTSTEKGLGGRVVATHEVPAPYLPRGGMATAEIVAERNVKEAPKGQAGIEPNPHGTKRPAPKRSTLPGDTLNAKKRAALDSSATDNDLVQPELLTVEVGTWSVMNNDKGSLRSKISTDCELPKMSLSELTSPSTPHISLRGSVTEPHFAPSELPALEVKPLRIPPLSLLSSHAVGKNPTISVPRSVESHPRTRVDDGFGRGRW
mmetsp:Transcript_16501/g.67797  ORF Transcript_16501/g.67797 Transcript_16501/m.67797 type:complete len:234 (-) Transcript_16501:233-934(-)|eukprot:CAMPEP_0113968532 /NCGR_PEP_ID=MMETSP0011_2-20120614/9605_1 /TAXON_ID=101924 /ORGANISM="Rhodosorus marinus" /LENGTH=233 /DNA_ID=CAMNT_0000981671 /DNA_START=365 /DNA_END=1066 /DNA_ORIENTATION=- /assembly_acc=CAM_ASM_000156